MEGTMIENFRSHGRTITESDLVSFSALTGDWHPQHSDASWASSSQFSERVAHGMLVLSYSIGLAPLDPDRVVALRGLDSVTFKRPVSIGDTIRVEGEVSGTKSLGDGLALVDIRWRVLNQDDLLVARATVQALCRADERATAPQANGGADPERRPAAANGAGDQDAAIDGADLYGDRILL
jgi:3-hydroxybutyryl-CoA dehydratase